MENKILKISTQTGDMFNECTTDLCQLNENYAHLKECGFEAIDYNMDHFLTSGEIKSGKLNDFWDKSLDELYEYFAPTKKAIKDNGIVFSQTHASFPLYVKDLDTVNDYMIKVMEKSIAVCAFLGCNAVVAHPFSDSDKEFEMKVNLEMYKKMIPAAKKYGVKICLENMYLNFNNKPVEGSCSNAYEACYYIDKLNEEAGENIFGFCLDIGHANLLSKNIKNFITKLSHRLTCLHIHDNDGIFDLHMMPYTQQRNWGLYCTDWNGMIEGLKEIDYQGNLSFESFMGVKTFPKEVETEALKLLCAIGKHFRNRILEK